MITFKRLDLIATYGATLAVMLSSLSVMFAANNILGVDQYGKFIFYLSIAGLLTSLFSIRSGESVIRLMSVGAIPRAHLQAAAFITDAFLAIVLLTIVIPSCSTLLQAFGPNQYGDQDVMFLLGASFVVPILSGVVSGTLLFDEHFKILGLLRLTSPLLRLTLLPFLLSTGFDLYSLATVYLLSATISCFGAWIIFFYLYGRIQLKLPLVEMLTYWSEAKKIYLSLFFKSFITNSDSTIVGIVAGAEKVGILNTIKLLLQPANFLFTPLGQMILPRVAKYVKSGQRIEVVTSIGTYSIAGFFLVSCIFLLAIVADDMLSGLTKVSFMGNFGVVTYVGVQALSLVIGDWWFRSFSLSVNPYYSVKSALASAIYIWTICLCGSLLFGFEAFLILMSAMYLVRTLWFWTLLIRFKAFAQKG